MTIVSGKLDIFAPTFSMYAAPGCTIAQVLDTVPDLPRWFRECGVVMVDGMEIYRDKWRVVRPLEMRGGEPVLITLHPPAPEGGRGKQVLTLLATVALAITTAGIGAGVLLPGLGAQLAGSLGVSVAAGQSLLAAGVGIVGRMAIAALTPPPVAPNVGASAQNSPTAGISGNALERLAQLPAVLGAIDYSPPHLVRPWTTLQGQYGEVQVRTIVGLAGYYDVSNLRINGVDVGELSDLVGYQIRAGAPGDSALSINNTTCVEQQERIELTNVELEDPSETSANVSGEPKWHHVRTAGLAGKFSIRLLFQAGLFRQGGSDPERVVVPFRIEFRKVGDPTWLKGPEVHFSCRKLTSFDYRREVTFEWVDSVPSGSTGALSSDESHQPQAYWRASPSQSFQYTAESYFNPGSGNYARNLRRTQTGYVIYLQESVFPPGAYEFRVKRGEAFDMSDFTPSSYSYDGNVNKSHFFNVVGGNAAVTQDKFVDRCVLETTLTETEDYPFGFTGGAALIAVIARGMQVNAITAMFERRAPVWDGTSWATVAPTRNPAALYRQALLGRDNPDPVNESRLIPGNLEEWYDACVSAGYECNAVVQGYSVTQVQQLIASAGWAVPRNNARRGVIREYDRSAEPIRQKFTPLNSSNFMVSREFDERPHALRIEFYDEEDGYKLTDTYVYADGYDRATATRFEALTEIGVTNRQKVRDKGLLYLRQIYRRARRYTLDAGPEVLISERGDLVGVTSDVLSVHHFFGLVHEVLVSGGDIVGLVLQSAIDMSFSDETTPGISIRRRDGTFVFREIEPHSGETDTVVFAEPFEDTREIGRDCLVSVGEIGREYRRCLIHGIEWKSDLSASLTLLDVADDMWPIVAGEEEENPGPTPVSAWTFAGISDAVTVGTDAITLSEPAGAQENDLLIACIAMRDAAVFTLPSGWTEVRQVNNAPLASGIFPQASALMACRVRGSTAPALEFTRTGGGVAHGRVMALRGNATSSPLDTHKFATAQFPVGVEAMTTAEADEIIVFMAALAPDILGSTVPAVTAINSVDPMPGDWTTRGYSKFEPGGLGLNIVTAVKPAAGATSTMSQVVSGSFSYHVAIAAAFRPAAV